MLQIKRNKVTIVLPPRMLEVFPQAGADLARYHAFVDDDVNVSLTINGNVYEFEFYYAISAQEVVSMYLWWEMHLEQEHFNDPLTPDEIWFQHITIPETMTNR